MAIIISSLIDSELESTLRCIDCKECNPADHYGWLTIDENSVVDSYIIASFDVAEKRSLQYNKDYILCLSQTTYSRADYPGLIGDVEYTWDPVNQVFYEPQPFASWILNTTTWLWESPIPYPADGMNYIWKEELYQSDNTTGWVHPFPK